MKRQILLLGGCCVDEILECDYLPKSGDDIIIQSKSVQLGGSCLNVATAMKRCHKEPVIYSAIGNKDYAAYFEQLSQEGFDTSCIYKQTGQTGSCTILVDSTKERTFLTYPGVEGHFDESLIPDEILNEIEWIYLSGIFLTYKEESQKVIPFLLRMIHKGKHILFDVASLVEKIEINLLQECIECSSIIKGNEVEIETLRKRLHLSHVSDIINVHTKMIIKTCGSTGSITYLDNNRLATPSFNITPIDTTGAGDNFVGAFLSSLLDNLSTQECLKIATEYGAMSTTHPNGRIPLHHKGQSM